MYYIGRDFHKRKISYCVKDSSGKVFAEGSLRATRLDLDHWMRSLPKPWSAAMEATMFTGWIYDHLKPHAGVLKVAHPLMLRAMAAAKKKNDRIDASKICDCLRCDFLPESYMASTAIRERRRTLRYRNLLVIAFSALSCEASQAARILTISSAVNGIVGRIETFGSLILLAGLLSTHCRSCAKRKNAQSRLSSCGARSILPGRAKFAQNI
jgi:Transposase